MVVVKWLDAVTHLEKDIKVIESLEPEELLAEKETFGHILKQNDKAIVIMFEDAGDEADITVIPKDWVTSIRPWGEKDKRPVKRHNAKSGKVRR